VGRHRAGPVAVQIVPRDPLAPRDLAANPTGMASRTPDALLGSEAQAGARVQLTNAALAAPHPRKAAIRASQAVLQAARNGAKILDDPAASPEGALGRQARIAWRRPH